MASPSARSVVQLNKILGRTPRSPIEAALMGVASEPIDPLAASGALAAKILSERDAQRRLEMINQALDRLHLAAGRPLGYGSEAIVFDAGDKVIKVGRDPFQKGPYQAPELPGIAPYLESQVIGPLRMGVQDKAAEVASRERLASDRDYERLWRSRSDALWRSLDRRGIQWDDDTIGNVGIMPDGNLSAIDGWFRPIAPGASSMRAYPTTEDAIRALRVFTGRQ